MAVVRSGAFLLGSLTLACSGRPNAGTDVSLVAARATARAHDPGAGEREPATPARVFPPVERTEVTAEVRDTDGGRHFVAQGLRVVESPEGALEAASEFLPGARSLAFELPPRLGGGYLFVVNTSGSALFWRAPTFTGALRPLARLDAEVERVVPGFERLYVQRGRGAPWIALDADSGEALELGSLPPSPGYGDMAFADDWLGAVELPLRGVLATFDAGGTWHPLGLAHADLAVGDGGIAVTAPGTRLRLAPNGRLEPLAAAPEVTRAPGTARRLPAPLPLGERPLETAVLHGYPDAPGTALVASRGMLARVRLRDGAILERQPEAYAGRAACEPVTLGAGVGFVCGEPHGPSSVYALGRGLTLVPVLGFEEPRRVAQNGQGALVVNGSCAPRGAHAPLLCVIPARGASYETPLRSPDQRAVPLADGGLALIIPRPRAAAPGSAAAKGGMPSQPKKDAASSAVPLGTLTLVQKDAPDQSVPLHLDAVDDPAARAVVESGFWLDSFELAPNGELRGWVAGSDSFVGVRVKRDGSVRVGSPEAHLDRALLSGRFGLVVGRSGGLRETIDGGFEWTDGELPAEPDLRAQRTFGTASGCTLVGCAISGWLRVGWKMGERDRLTAAPIPEPTRMVGSGGNRWSLDCRATGEQSRPPLRQAPQPEDRAVSPWNPLAELAPPARRPSDLGMELSNEAELRLYHGYAWGPASDSWARDARFQLRVRDPYRVIDAVWSTSPTTSPWSSAVLAADAFGRSPNGSPSTWRILTDPVKHAGLLLISLRGVLDLFLLEEGRAISRVKTAGGLGVVTSVAVAGGRFYVGALGEGRSLRIYRVEHGELDLLGDFPEVAAHTDAPILAPAAAGEGLGVWLHDSDYYLFPFEPSSGRFDAPLVTRASELAAMPAACSTGEDGYVVGDALSLEPNVELSGVGPGAGTGVATGNGIEVRLIVSPTRVCVDGVSAPLGSRGDAERVHSPRGRSALRGVRTPSAEPRGDTPTGGVPGRDTSPSGPGATLVLAAPDGSRRAFRCVD